MLTLHHLQRRCKLNAAGAALAVLAVAGSASAQVGLGLIPMREELALGAGAQHSGVLTLNNDSPGKVRVVAELLDFYIDPTATPQFGRILPQEADSRAAPGSRSTPWRWSSKAIRRSPCGIPYAPRRLPPRAAITARELGWELTHVYGLTETSPLITFCEPLPEHETLSLQERAQIKARQGVELVSSGELKVVDEHGNEVARDAQTLGEITVCGNVVMKGYYNDADATNAAIKDGWFHSGDAAVVHPDGYVEIRDRFKDVIISGGENISSVEIEGCLLRNPAVQEVAVVGMPHQRWGEAPHAFVVLRQGAQATEEELKLHVRNAIAHFKAPQWVTFVDELPKTATGKVQKFVLRKGKTGVFLQ